MYPPSDKFYCSLGALSYEALVKIQSDRLLFHMLMGLVFIFIFHLVTSTFLIYPIQSHAFIIVFFFFFAISLLFFMNMSVPLPSICSCCCYAHPFTSLLPPSLHRVTSLIILSASSPFRSQPSHKPSPVSGGGFILLLLKTDAPRSQNLPVESKRQRLSDKAIH